MVGVKDALNSAADMHWICGRCCKHVSYYKVTTMKILNFHYSNRLQFEVVFKTPD
jgi:hypothetical protein